MLRRHDTTVAQRPDGARLTNAEGRDDLLGNRTHLAFIIRYIKALLSSQVRLLSKCLRSNVEQVIFHTLTARELVVSHTSFHSASPSSSHSESNHKYVLSKSLKDDHVTSVCLTPDLAK